MLKEVSGSNCKSNRRKWASSIPRLEGETRVVSAARSHHPSTDAYYGILGPFKQLGVPVGRSFARPPHGQQKPHIPCL
jgi:hypothetical protein